MNFENQANIEGHSAATLSVSTTADSVGPLTPGVYYVWSTVDTYIRVDANETRAEAVTTNTGFPILADLPGIPVRVTRPAYLAGIAGENGTLSYHRIS